MVTQNPNFSSTILFTNEVQFTRQGIINFHNDRLAQENPHALKEVKHQHTFFVNLWSGVVGDNLIEPYFLLNRLKRFAPIVTSSYVVCHALCSKCAGVSW